MEKNLGHATAYGYAKSKGYSGTEDEFAQLMADYASVGQSAAQSAEQAAASATSASDSAATAASAAQTATSKASEAVTAAGTATAKASEANTSAQTASTAAQTATDKADEATTAAATATTKASEASESATTATAAKADAESARDSAAQSASRAEQSAESIDPDEFNRKIYAAFATDTVTGAIAYLPDGADSIPMKDVLVHIEPVQEGSGDPSPDNVRPITGWTGAKVTRCRKNMLPTMLESFTRNGLTCTKQSDGSYVINGTATAETYFSFASPINTAINVPIPRNTPLVLSGCPANGTSNTYRIVVYLYKDNTYLNVSISDYGDHATINRNDADALRVSANIKADVTCENLVFRPMLRPASDTDSTYEPYSGSTYTLAFPVEAGTVYGGTLDVTTGELVVTHKMRTFDGSEDWRWSAISLRPYFAFTDIANIKPVITNLYPYSAIEKAIEKTITTNAGNGDGIWVKDSEIAPDLASWKAFLSTSPLQVVYELATPITYQLTPQEITSLLGENNLWADCGDTEVEYRASTKMYIDKKITEAVSTLS